MGFKGWCEVTRARKNSVSKREKTPGREFIPHPRGTASRPAKVWAEGERNLTSSNASKGGLKAIRTPRREWHMEGGVSGPPRWQNGLESWRQMWEEVALAQSSSSGDGKKPSKRKLSEISHRQDTQPFMGLSRITSMSPLLKTQPGSLGSPLCRTNHAPSMLPRERVHARECTYEILMCLF